MSDAGGQITPNKRLHGLDALRAVAMMLGVWLHAGMAYIEGLPPFFWAINDPDRSALIGYTITFVHGWRMEVFFLLSGFFTAMLALRRGVVSTLKQRTLRIVLPFGLAVLLIQPLCAVVWGLGYTAQWGYPASNTVTMMLKTSWNISHPGAPSELVRLWHLWFLYELIWFVAIGLALHAVFPRELRRAGAIVSRALSFIVGSWWGALVLMLPVGLALMMHGPSGAQPNMTLVPNWASLAYYALPFACGWILYPAREHLDRLARRWWCPMAMGLLIAFPAHLWAMRHGAGMFVDAPRGPYVVGVASHALMTTGIGLGMIGLFMRVLASPGPRLERWVRYGSDMAYWVYLAHLPLVVGAGILLVDWRAPAVVKMGIVVGGSGLVLLVSYQLLVRHTPIGWLLNGRRTRPGAINPADSLEQGPKLGDAGQDGSPSE